MQVHGVFLIPKHGDPKLMNITVVDPRDCGKYHLFGKIFAESLMTMKEMGPGWGASLVPHLESTNV